MVHFLFGGLAEGFLPGLGQAKADSGLLVLDLLSQRAVRTGSSNFYLQKSQGTVPDVEIPQPLLLTLTLRGAPGWVS